MATSESSWDGGAGVVGRAHQEAEAHTVVGKLEHPFGGAAYAAQTEPWINMQSNMQAWCL